MFGLSGGACHTEIPDKTSKFMSITLKHLCEDDG